MIIQIRKDYPQYKTFCEKLSSLCKNINTLVEKGNNYGNAIAKLIGISGYNSMNADSTKTWMKFRKFIQDMVPYNTITLDLLKDHEIAYSTVSSIFSDRKSYFYGGKEKFKTLLLSSTRFKFHMIGGRMMIKNKIDQCENNFVKALVENVDNGQ